MVHDTPLITIIVAGLGLAFIFASVAQRFRIPPLVGYLLAGVVVHAKELDGQGTAVLPKPLTLEECTDVASLYSDEQKLHSRIVTARHRGDRTTPAYAIAGGGGATLSGRRRRLCGASSTGARGKRNVSLIAGEIPARLS